ncbi:MAG TPA: HAMP domain-containing sensor histidine kinase, partial [Acidimicrobiia bacterium]|nr:HAMP domain-containing sensor histidine kinase [Acidimicrobiia bacterium]
MTRVRRRLRTRLVVAMMAIALGVLLLTAAVTAGLARRSEVSNARHDVQDRAEVVGPEFDTLIDQLPEARTAAETAGGRRQLRRIRVLLNTTLRASNGAIVAIDADGQVHEGLAVLLGGTGNSPTLPSGVSADDLDTERLVAGTTQQGRDGGTVFVARPLTAVNGTTPVVVLSQEINERPFGGNGLAVLGAAAISLGIAALVAMYLARRMTRPLAAMETTARSIASGDLAARVDTTDVHDDELASLALAINAMANDLDVARGHERAFLLSVSHDLRTPLTSIRGYAEAIADGTVEGKDSRIRAAEVISSESRRLERLVADLLDLARLDAHQFSLHPTPVDVHAVVRDAVEAFGPAAADLNLVLGVEPGDPVPAAVDAQRLAQIVANLVENALKFATTRVVVGVRAVGDQVELHVDDDGPGIAPADLPHVFERLYTSRTAPGRTLGTGIGLAIVHELAVAMDGDARVEPIDAEGT